MCWGGGHSDLMGSFRFWVGHSDLDGSFRFRLVSQIRGLIRLRGHSNLGIIQRGSFRFGGRVIQILGSDSDLGGQSFRFRRVIQICSWLCQLTPHTNTHTHCKFCCGGEMSVGLRYRNNTFWRSKNSWERFPLSCIISFGSSHRLG